MKILGIDFGTKTMGLAISDDIGLLGHGIGVIKRIDLHHDLLELQKNINYYRVDRIVVGLPLNMDGSLGKAAEQVLTFVDNLKSTFSLPVDTWDERLSTVEAERILRSREMSRQKRRKTVDKVAAAIILQGYLDHIKGNHSS